MSWESDKKWRAKVAGHCPDSAHGTINGYRIYKCTCDACRGAHNELARVWRARKRRIRDLVARGLPEDWEGDL